MWEWLNTCAGEGEVCGLDEESTHPPMLQMKLAYMEGKMKKKQSAFEHSSEKKNVFFPQIVNREYSQDISFMTFRFEPKKTFDLRNWRISWPVCCFV